MFTLILGPLVTGVAAVLMIRVLRLGQIPRVWKIEAVTAVSLSLFAFIWMLLLARHIWG